MHFFSRIHYLFREFTLDLLSFTRNHGEFTIIFTLSMWIQYLLCDFTPNQLSISRFHYELTLSSLSVSRISYKFTICFAILLWIHHRFCEITIESLFILWIYYIPKIILVDSAWINYFFLESFLNSISISRTQFASALFIANRLRIMTHSRYHDGILT